MIAFNVEYIIPDSIPVDQEELKPIIESKTNTSIENSSCTYRMLCFFPKLLGIYTSKK